MLKDGTGFKKVYIAAGFTDLRRGIDGLARIIRFQFKLDPYKRIENGSFKWPRSAEEVMEITSQQYQMLMQGMEIVAKRPIQEVKDPAYAM